MNKQLQMYKQAKADGLTARDVWETVKRGVDERAKKEGWRDSERAATLADVSFELREVFGKRATRFLFEDARAPQKPPQPPQLYRVMRDCCTSGNCLTCIDQSLVGTPIRVKQQGGLSKSRAEQIAKAWGSYSPTVEPDVAASI